MYTGIVYLINISNGSVEIYKGMKQDVSLYLFYRIQWMKQKLMIQAESCLVRTGRKVVLQELCTHTRLVLV